MINETAQYLLQKPARSPDQIRPERKMEKMDREMNEKVERKGSEKVQFGRIYERIGKENRVAKESARTAEKESQPKTDSIGSSDKLFVNSSSAKQQKLHIAEETENRIESDFMDKQIADCCQVEPEVQSDSAAEQAGELLKEVLVQISSLLGIEVDENLEEISFEKLDPGLSGHLSEILWALDKIGGMLDVAAAGQEMLQLGELKLDPEMAAELSLLLKNQSFQLELGLNQLGIGEEVKELLAEKCEKAVRSGIPQATDPAELKMTSAEISRLFGKAVQEDLHTAIEHIQKLLTQGGAQTETRSSEMQNVISMMNAVDARTMRAMLKIDGQKAGQSNTVSGTGAVSVAEVAAETGSEEMKLVPGGSKTSSSENAVPVQPMTSDKEFRFTFNGIDQLQAAVKKPESTAGTEEMQLNVGQIGKSASDAVIFQPAERLSSVLTRMTDEAIVRQISEKMQSAVRSGVHELRIQLRPESLGEVRLSIRMESDVVFARIQVENQQVKQIVEAHLQSLKDALEEQNIHAGSFSVDVGGNRDGSAGGFGRELSETASSWNNRGDMADSGVGIMPEEAFEHSVSGSDTGRRYGSNTFEYFA
ncbi:MAG: flagellar hook-length control protein FliK [Chitinispirillaceae bacterium]